MTSFNLKRAKKSRYCNKLFSWRKVLSLLPLNSIKNKLKYKKTLHLEDTCDGKLYQQQKPKLSSHKETIH